MSRLILTVGVCGISGSGEDCRSTVRLYRVAEASIGAVCEYCPEGVHADQARACCDVGVDNEGDVMLLLL